MSLDTINTRQFNEAAASVHAVFEAYSLSDISKELEDIIKAATKNTVYKKHVPADVLYLMDNVIELCNIAFILSPIEHTNGVLENTDKIFDLSHSKDFIGHLKGHNAWNCFPRNLTIAQYNNPYKAIKKFCRFKTEVEWCQILKDITAYALGKGEIQDEYSVLEILIIRKRLLQLIEACHLLDIRLNQKEN